MMKLEQYVRKLSWLILSRYSSAVLEEVEITMESSAGNLGCWRLEGGGEAGNPERNTDKLTLQAIHHSGIKKMM
jgi:hypothetical protein